MTHWSPNRCQVWVRLFFWWIQCPHPPILAKDSKLLCRRHKDLEVIEGIVKMKWYRFGIPL